MTSLWARASPAEQIPGRAHAITVVGPKHGQLLGVASAFLAVDGVLFFGVLAAVLARCAVSLPPASISSVAASARLTTFSPRWARASTNSTTRVPAWVT